MKRSVNIFLLVLTATVGHVGVIQAQWYFGPSMNYERHGLDVVNFENKMYAIGGFHNGTILEVFENGVWSELQPLPEPQGGLAAAIVEDKIYTFGNYGQSNITQIYDIQTNTWTTGPNIPQNLYWATAEAVGSDIYLIAGYDPAGDPRALNTLYILDTVTDTWTTGSNLPEGNQIPASAVYNDQIYVFGNYDHGAYYMYDIETDTWFPFNGPPSGLGSGSEAVTVGNEIYLIGGFSGYIYEAYKNVEIYNPATQQWRTGDSLNIGRYQFGATYLDGSLYAVGGHDGSSSVNDVEILDIIYVESIELSLVTKGRWTNARATVLIWDKDNNPVAKAEVHGHWEGLTTDSDVFTTKRNGTGSCDSDQLKNPEGTWSFHVDDVVKAGYMFRGDLGQTSASIVVP